MTDNQDVRTEFEAGARLAGYTNFNRERGRYCHVELEVLYQGYLLGKRAAQPAPVVPEGEPYWPEYHHSGMGCGLEDRGITDRYEAMKYGWDTAFECCTEAFDDWLAAAPAQGQKVECQECERYRAVLEGACYPLAQGFHDLSIEQARHIGTTVADMTKTIIAERDQLRAELAALKAQQVGQEQVEIGEVRVSVKNGSKCFEFEEYNLAYSLPDGLHYLYTAPQPAPAQDVAGFKLEGLNKVHHQMGFVSLGFKTTEQTQAAVRELRAALDAHDKQSGGAE